MMKMGALSLAARAAAVVAVTLALAAAPAAAQSADDCRCVDREGNEIRNCSCFRAPNVQIGSFFGLSDARPRLGVSVDAGQSARRDALGAFVTDVMEGGPADAAGIRTGDVITSIDGMSLFEPIPGEAEEDFDLDRSIPVQRLLAIAEDLEPGEEVVVEYRRGDDERSATVAAEDLSAVWGDDFAVVAPNWDVDRFRGQLRALTEGARSFRFRWDGDEELHEREGRMRFDGPDRGREWVEAFGAPDGPMERLRTRDGLELIELNPSLGGYFGVDEGVLVANAAEDHPLGLRGGDVVLRVGERRVSSPARLRRILDSYGADEDIALTIRRDGRETTVTGRRGG